jgi:hypothetical protein
VPFIVPYPLFVPGAAEIEVGQCPFWGEEVLAFELQPMVAAVEQIAVNAANLKLCPIMCLRLAHPCAKRGAAERFTITSLARFDPPCYSARRLALVPFGRK